MLPIQAVNGATSKHAFGVDWGNTTTGAHPLNRPGKEFASRVIVEPGTRNIYVVGNRNTQPSEESNSPGGASANHYAQRAFIVKFNQQGDVLWQRELNKDGMKNDPSTGNTWRRYSRFDSVCINALTGDVYAVGYTSAQYQDGYNWATLSGDCLVAKYNSSGTLQYQKFYGRNKTDAGIGVEWFPLEEYYAVCVPLSDGTFVASGSTSNHPGSNTLVYTARYNYNGIVSRWNSNGTVSWSKWISVDGTQNTDTPNISSTSVSLGGVDSSDNVYILVNGGTSGSTEGSYIIKFNSSGTVQWQKNIQRIFTNPFNNTLTQWSDLTVSKNGDMYLHAYRGSGNDNGIVKLNSNAVVQWVKSFNGTGDQIHSMQVDDDQNLWFYDSTSGEAHCIDSNGTPIRNVQITTNSGGGFYRGFTVDEGYITMITGGKKIGRNTSNTNEHNLGVLRAEISGVNDGAFTHTNSDGSTLTVTVSTPSTGSVTNHSSPSISNSSQVSIINYAGNTPVRLNNGTATNFTNSTVFHSKTLTV